MAELAERESAIVRVCVCVWGGGGGGGKGDRRSGREGVVMFVR
jgi:hypothetical protein